MAGVEFTAWVNACDALARVAEQRGLTEASIAGHGVSISFKRLPFAPEALPAGDGPAMTKLEQLAARIRGGEVDDGSESE